jgi:catechol 2,3-dioxygenase-like lactoylglutathione lyase family enzyme
MFDHVGIAVADLAASERFYRTVLSVLGAEPSHADSELVEVPDGCIDHLWIRVRGARWRRASRAREGASGGPPDPRRASARAARRAALARAEAEAWAWLEGDERASGAVGCCGEALGARILPA